MSLHVCPKCYAEVPVRRAVDDVFADALDLSLHGINKLRAALWGRSQELEAQARHDMAQLAVHP